MCRNCTSSGRNKIGCPSLRSDTARWLPQAQLGYLVYTVLATEQGVPFHILVEPYGDQVLGLGHGVMHIGCAMCRIVHVLSILG